MERKWNWNIDEGTSICIVGTWFFVGMITFIVTSSLTRSSTKHGHAGHVTWPTWATLALWIGPFILVGLGYVGWFIWDNRPRRIWVPVKQDARAAHRNELERNY